MEGCSAVVVPLRGSRRALGLAAISGPREQLVKACTEPPDLPLHRSNGKSLNVHCQPATLLSYNPQLDVFLAKVEYLFSN